MMKQLINENDRKTFDRDSIIFSTLFLLMLCTAVPLIHFLDTLGIVIYVALLVATFIYAERVEKHKKQLDIQTYREITAFSEGVTLDEIEKARESGKRPYQKILFPLAFAAIALIINGSLAYWLF